MKFVTYQHPKLGELKVPIDPPIERTAVLERTKPEDYVAGASSPLPYEIVRNDADWRSLIFLPDRQYFPTFDSFACTNFSPSNSRKLQYKQSSGEEYNFSEKAMAELSGTQPGVGNYMTADPDWVRKNGLILNKDWPNEEGTDSVENWFKPVPLEVQKKAMRVKENYEWVDPSYASLQYHLKQCPVTVMINAGSTNHDVCAVYVDQNGVWYMDSYPHTTADNFLAITTQVPKAALKIISKLMNTVYFVHIKDTQEYGLLSVSPVGKQYVPASTEADLIARGGIAVPLINGKPDYSKALEISLPV